MVENLYNFLFIGSMIFLALLMFGYLFRSVVGPSFFDRILAVNSISTIVILIIAIIAVLDGNHYVVDVILIYAMLSFVTVMIVCKSYLRSHKKDKSHDFDNLKRKDK